MVQDMDVLSSVHKPQEQSRPGKVRDWQLSHGLKIGHIAPFLGKFRPIIGRCCQSCSPRSWENYFHKSFASMGFCNAACITEERTRFRGWLVRRLCYVIFVFDENIKRDVPLDLQEKIYNNKRVQDVINSEITLKREKCPVNGSSSARLWKKQILQLLGHVQSTISPLLIRLVHWGVLRLLNSAFLNVQLHTGQLEMVRQVSQGSSRNPVIFLSTHKSQFDGILLSLVLSSQGLGMPCVASSEKQGTPTLCSLLKRLGWLFLPPESENRMDSNSQALSQAVLASYIEVLLAEGQSLLLFLEEPFSGVWRLAPHGRQWLELICSSVISGAISDVLVVPVGVSYESLLNNFQRVRWLLSDPPSLFSSVVSALCLAIGSFGGIRIDFAQPFSLQEYIANNRCRRPGSSTSLKELLLPTILGKRARPVDAERSLEGYTDRESSSLLKDDEQLVVTRLSLHSLSAGVSCSAIMTVGIVSTLLLHRYREGVFFSQLTNDFSHLIEEILFRNFDVGFSGQRQDLVLHALSLLKHSVSLYRISEGNVFILPKDSESAVTELSLNSATILPVFASEAVGACAINALITEMAAFIDCVDLHMDILLGQEEITEKALCLCHLIPSEILLITPCLSSYCYCQDAVDKLIHSGLLLAEEVPNQVPACDTGRRRFSEKLLWKAMDDFSDSDSDYNEECGKRSFKLNQMGSSPDFFDFLCHLLSPALRTFGRVAECLWEFHCPKPESELLEKVHSYLLKRSQLDGSYECASRSLAISAIQTFKALGVLKESLGCSGVTTLYIADTFTVKTNQSKLVRFIQQFIYKERI